ncbi:uncharacterized protein LOC131258210 [Magnolia sinica]|uniref:uncharacterized protein LOC131258210 n=1 Tax=Magnolia sinica TaxID=86752 RepID=UPI00265A71BE|nr:uncharacterized protein LOC131258210 [Magnolia sinica]
MVARFVSKAIGRGQARAETEAATKAVIDSKNHEISLLQDKVQYYEVVCHEMCQRNQEVKEIYQRTCCKPLPLAKGPRNTYFRQFKDGKIEAEVILTRILSLGALQPGASRKYGTTIAPGSYAPVHQHFFVARMDMAIDCRPSETFNQLYDHYTNTIRSPAWSRTSSPQVRSASSISKNQLGT